VGAEQISGEPSKDEVGPTPFYTWAKELVTDAIITYIKIENIISSLHSGFLFALLSLLAIS
jgi:hypothetical protein